MYKNKLSSLYKNQRLTILGECKYNNNYSNILFFVHIKTFNAQFFFNLCILALEVSLLQDILFSYIKDQPS